MLPFVVDAVLMLVAIAAGAGLLYSLWRIRAQIERLHQQEEQLRKLSRAVEQSPSTVIITDLEGNIEYVNPKFTELTGYTLEEVLGRNPRILKSGSTPDAEYAALWRTITAGGEWHGELLNRKKNGDLYWEATSISPVRDASGVITHYLGVKEDITARKQAEEALRRSEVRNDALLSAIPDLVFRFNRDGVYLDARGDPLVRFRSFDEPLELTLGKTLFDLLPQTEARLIHGAIHRALDTGEMQTLEYRLDTVSGPLDFEARLLPVGPDEVISVARDVTARRRLEAALHISEEKYRSVAENANDAIAIVQDGMLRYFNPQAQALLGYSVEELHQLPFEAFLAPEGRAQAGERAARRGRGEPVSSRYEMTLLHKAGHPVRVEVNTSQIDYEGQPALLAFIRDISERKQAEDQIRRQNRELTLLNQVIETAASTLDMIDLLAAICRDLAAAFDVPQAATALLNLEGTAYEVVAEYLSPGKTSALGVRFPVQDNPVVDYMLAHKTPLVIPDVRTDSRLVYTPEGRAIIEARGTVSMLIVPLLMGDELIGTIGLDAVEPRVFTDDEIALAANVAAALSQALHNVHLYRQLRANQARLKAILDNASVGVVLLDSSGRYVQVNDRWAEMLGYSSDELLGRYHFDFIYPDDVPGCQQRLAGLQSGEAESYRLEARFSCGDGDFFWGDVSISAIRSPEGNLDAIVTVVADVTERKHAEDERERLISELDAFGHTVAHDLKSPLQGIIGYSSLLVEDLSQYSREDLARYLQIIEQYGHKMTAIINELLLLSRVRKLEEIDIGPVDMKPVVESALIRLEHLIRDKKVVITAPLEAWPVAFGYGPWIEEVWANYISNAIKYGGSPPRVQLGADCLPDGIVRFWVRDNGQGIPPDRLGQLFTEFARLSQTRLEGHGLGLSIVRRIMDKLGGDVGVESTPGQGSTFSFTLPGTDSHG